MGVVSNLVGRDEIEAGDHIYSWRKGYVYAHHGIYIGDGAVIHFTRAGAQEIGTGTFLDRLFESSMPSRGEIPCEDCGDQSSLEGVLVSCLDCFLSGGDLYRFPYGVSRAFFLAKLRSGTCSLARSDPSAAVLHRAEYLRQHGFGSYDLFEKNCEDFAIYCKTGLLVTAGNGTGSSGQWGASSLLHAPLRMLLWRRWASAGPR